MHSWPGSSGAWFGKRDSYGQGAVSVLRTGSGLAWVGRYSYINQPPWKLVWLNRKPSWAGTPTDLIALNPLTCPIPYRYATNTVFLSGKYFWVFYDSIDWFIFVKNPRNYISNYTKSLEPIVFIRFTVIVILTAFFKLKLYFLFHG